MAAALAVPWTIGVALFVKEDNILGEDLVLGIMYYAFGKHVQHELDGRPEVVNCHDVQSQNFIIVVVHRFTSGLKVCV